MTSQQAAFGKGPNNCSTYQLHLPSTSANLGRNTVNISVPIRIPPSSTDPPAALPLLSSPPGLNIPIQISTTTAIHAQKSHLSNQTSRSLLNIPLQVTNSRPAGNGNMVQLQMLNEKKIINVDVDKHNQHPQNTTARYITAPPQRHDMHGKLHEPIVSSSLQMSGGQVQLMSNSNNKTVLSQPIQVRSQSGGIYFMKSTGGIKTVSSMDTVVSSTVIPPTPIIVRKPNPSSSSVQALSLLPKSSVASRNSSALKCTPIAPKVNQQPLVIPKSKLAPNLVPVSIASGGKAQISTYLSTIKKPVSAPGSQESLLQPHTNQKIIITPYQKLPNKKIMLPNKPTSFNFQFANGQTHDPANVTLLSQLSNIPPLQPINKSMPPSSVNSNPTPSTSYQSDITFNTKTSNTNAEPISEKEYTISIPETDVIDDTYTVSISEVNNKGNNTEKSYTIPLPDKVKSLICKSSNVVDSGVQHDNMNVSNSVPAILRRSTDNNDKKLINSRRRMSANVEADLINKSESVKSKNLSEIMSRFTDNPNVSLLATNKKSSLYCEEQMELELDSKAAKNAEEFPSPAPVVNNTHVNKDRRKSRVSSDVHIIDIDNVAEKNLKIDVKRKDILEYLMDDTPGLQWSNGMARLKGSSLQFNMNEFGVIDVIMKENKPAPNKGKDKKASSPDQLYCCIECGCHGMPSEFISPMFCSNSCQNEWLKQKRQVGQSKKKSKPKKVLMKNTEKLEPISVKESEIEMDTLDSDLKANSDEYDCKELTIVEDIPILKNSWLTGDGFSWSKYLEYYKAKPAPKKLFKPLQTTRNCFKKGMKLEAIDPVHPAIFSVVTVVEMQGHRIRLHFDGFHEKYDFWVNFDSCNIFPAGWCENNKKTVRPPLGHPVGTSFSWNLYLRKSKAMAAPKHLFAHLNEMNCLNVFRVGMKLEAEDKNNSLTCVASVADVINNRILIHFDSWDDIYDFWADPSSPYIHPIGWCDEHEISLTPPDSYQDPEHFSWEDYLQKTKSVAVPARGFKPRPPNEFKIGMRLEAVDKRVPFLIRVATVVDVLCYQIKIAFDGWPDELAYWVDDDSSEIHPVGWCYYTGHSLEPPMTEEEFEVVGRCGTKGCHGFGNTGGLKMDSHVAASDCPYSLPPKNIVRSDRLEGILPPVEHSEPRSKEPRKITSNLPELKVISKIDRSIEVKKEIFTPAPERISPKRKREEDSKSGLSILNDDLSSESKRRRESPVGRDIINTSIFNPGYMPNPNKVKPPFWGGDCLSLKDILQKESFKVDPRNWSVSDVQRFVEQVTKSKERLTTFAKQRIDGEAFLMLAQDDLVKELGLKLGPAMKIYNSIIHLRERILS